MFSTNWKNKKWNYSKKVKLFFEDKTKMSKILGNVKYRMRLIIYDKNKKMDIYKKVADKVETSCDDWPIHVLVSQNYSALIWKIYSLFVCNQEPLPKNSLF